MANPTGPAPFIQKPTDLPPLPAKPSDSDKGTSIPTAITSLKDRSTQANTQLSDRKIEPVKLSLLARFWNFLCSIGRLFASCWPFKSDDKKKDEVTTTTTKTPDSSTSAAKSPASIAPPAGKPLDSPAIPPGMHGPESQRKPQPSARETAVPSPLKMPPTTDAEIPTTPVAEQAIPDASPAAVHTASGAVQPAIPTPETQQPAPPLIGDTAIRVDQNRNAIPAAPNAEATPPTITNDRVKAAPSTKVLTDEKARQIAALTASLAQEHATRDLLSKNLAADSADEFELTLPKEGSSEVATFPTLEELLSTMIVDKPETATAKKAKDKPAGSGSSSSQSDGKPASDKAPAKPADPPAPPAAPKKPEGAAVAAQPLASTGSASAPVPAAATVTATVTAAPPQAPATAAPSQNLPPTTSPAKPPASDTPPTTAPTATLPKDEAPALAAKPPVSPLAGRVTQMELDRNKPVGLPNPKRVTCYMNASLQAMGALAPLVNAFYKPIINLNTNPDKGEMFKNEEAFEKALNKLVPLFEEKAKLQKSLTSVKGFKDKEALITEDLNDLEIRLQTAIQALRAAALQIHPDKAQKLEDKLDFRLILNSMEDAGVAFDADKAKKINNLNQAIIFLQAAGVKIDPKKVRTFNELADQYFNTIPLDKQNALRPVDKELRVALAPVKREKVRQVLVDVLDGQKNKVSQAELTQLTYKMCRVLFHERGISSPDLAPGEENRQQDAATVIESILGSVVDLQHEMRRQRVIPEEGLMRFTGEVVPMVQLYFKPGQEDLQEMIDQYFSTSVEKGGWKPSESPAAGETGRPSAPGKNYPEYRESNKLFKDLNGCIGIHLKRFEIDPKGHVRKNLTKIDIPDDGLDFSKGFEAAKGKAQLKCIIQHKGGYAGGHYIAWVKKGDQWYCCDDDTVYQASASDLAQAKENAYILFFERPAAK